jgi:hypothetical protein
MKRANMKDKDNTSSDYKTFTSVEQDSGGSTASPIPLTYENLDIKTIRTKIDSMKEEMKNLANLTNYYRRIYYAESELMIMDIERSFKIKENYNLSEKDTQLKECLEELTFISKELKLLFSNKHLNKRKLFSYILYKIEEILRAIAVVIAFFFSGLLLTLPCIIFCARSFDTYLVRSGFVSPFYQISNHIKTFIAVVILRVAGVDLITEGLDYGHYGKECSIVCFSHSSTIDAFVISNTIPVRHYTLVCGFSYFFFCFCSLLYHRRRNPSSSWYLSLDGIY